MGNNKLRNMFFDLLEAKDEKNADVAKSLIGFTEALYEYLNVSTSISTVLFSETDEENKDELIGDSFVFNQKVFDENFEDIFSHYIYLFHEKYKNYSDKDIDALFENKYMAKLYKETIHNREKALLQYILDKVRNKAKLKNTEIVKVKGVLFF